MVRSPQALRGVGANARTEPDGLTATEALNCSPNGSAALACCVYRRALSLGSRFRRAIERGFVNESFDDVRRSGTEPDGLLLSSASTGQHAELQVG